jgi:predicted DNA-binding protein (MmcQ/YjbR family)
MDIEKIWKYCSQKNGVSESFPFNETTLVFKVVDKMFALFDVENFQSINLKCDPEKALELREQYSGILPGYHMNKKHWNTISINEDVSDALIFELIDHSYTLIYKSLPKKVRDGI